MDLAHSRRTFLDPVELLWAQENIHCTISEGSDKKIIEQSVAGQVQDVSVRLVKVCLSINIVYCSVLCHGIFRCDMRFLPPFIRIEVIEPRSKYESNPSRYDKPRMVVK